MNKISSLFLISIIISSCSTLEQSIDQLYKEVRSSSEYTVKENETLWSIALRNNTSPRKIALRNNLKKPYVIYPGQKLNLSDLESIESKITTAIKWKLPTSPSIKQNREGNFWYIFNGEIGDPIFATRNAKVVLSGPVLPGYGNFIMLDHGDSYLSLYAHCKDIFVTKGEEVLSGQQIATIGSSEINKPTLKFQVRKSGSPVDISEIKFN
jgi:murein DD-endopeptidase MepM/ murein hydrolase activator NlpD